MLSATNGANLVDLAVHFRDHVILAASALALAAAVALPLGAWIAKAPQRRSPALEALGVGRVVPSLAVLMLAIPVLGVGFRPALLALALLAIPPIAINTDLGLRSVPEMIREAALGLGMSAREIRRRVEWPLAFPVVFAGIRTATVEVIASATLAAFVGGGGLGEFIINGLANNDISALLTGAISVALLALGAETALGLIERRLPASH